MNAGDNYNRPKVFRITHGGSEEDWDDYGWNGKHELKLYCKRNVIHAINNSCCFIEESVKSVQFSDMQGNPRHHVGEDLQETKLTTAKSRRRE